MQFSSGFGIQTCQHLVEDIEIWFSLWPFSNSGLLQESGLQIGRSHLASRVIEIQCEEAGKPSGIGIQKGSGVAKSLQKGCQSMNLQQGIVSFIT